MDCDSYVCLQAGIFILPLLFRKIDQWDVYNDISTSHNDVHKVRKTEPILSVCISFCLSLCVNV